MQNQGASTVLQLQTAARQALHKAQVPNAARDVDVLLAHVLQRDLAWLYTYPERLLKPEHTAQMQQLVARRAAREPVAYLTGCKQFYGLDFKVDRRVLIPRPETELLVDTALAHLRGHTAVQQQAAKILDVGCGSGAVAVSIAHHCPQAHVWGCDICPQALAVAQHNVSVHAVRVQLCCSDLLTRVPPGPYAVIAANLPYVSPQHNLPPDVRLYEPHIALYAAKRGTAVIQRLIAQASSYLIAGGVLLMECGTDQDQQIQRCFDSAAWHVRWHQDLRGIKRVVEAVRL